MRGTGFTALTGGVTNGGVPGFAMIGPESMNGCLFFFGGVVGILGTPGFAMIGPESPGGKKIGSSFRGGMIIGDFVGNGFTGIGLIGSGLTRLGLTGIGFTGGTNSIPLLS